MKKVGCITCKEYEELYYDDQHLIPIFKKEGIDLVPIIWDQPIDYNAFDLLVFRSAWDYHQKTERFTDWLKELEKSKVTVCNPVSIIQENYDKRYLKSLEEKGINIIPTKFFDTVSSINLKKILQENNWQKGIIKPTISMSAYHTYTFDKDDCNSLQAQLFDYYGNTAVMVQQFAPEIISEGEWSIVFYDKQYCLSVLKKPKKGDFRVQGELGGTLSVAEPPKAIIAEAKKVLESYSEDILYARIDGIIHEGHFQLMEAELIDPELYFRTGEKGRYAFLKAIQKRL